MNRRLGTASTSALLVVCFSLPALRASSALEHRVVKPEALATTFAAHSDFTAGNNPQAVAIGDLNGDGKPDLVIANALSSTVSVLLNTTAPGATTPTFATKVDFTTGTTPVSVAIVDLNGDGKRDLAVTNYDETLNSVSILRNTTAIGATTPAFAVKQNFTTGPFANPTGITAGDVNGDGVPDLAVACIGLDYVSVLLNTTAPGATTFTFSAHQDFAAAAAESVVMGDLNGDGRADLAVAGPTPNNVVSVLLNTMAPGAATPTFAARQDFATGSSPSSVAIGDLTGDGKPDLAIACLGSNSLSVLLNTTATGATTFTFSSHLDSTTLGSPQSVGIKDLNGDGILDVVVTGQGSANVSVFVNTGGVFFALAARQDYATGTTPWSVATGDLNGDGIPDLAVANRGSSNASVLLNKTHAGQLTTFFTMGQNFPTPTLSGPRGTAVGDLNGDGKPDLAVADYYVNKVSVLLNTTTPGATAPTFAARVDFATGQGVDLVRIADINGDGKPDLITLNGLANSVSVLRNTTASGASTPTFAAKQDLVTGNDLFGMAVMDINGDGKVDIVVSNNTDATVSVLLNQTAPGSSSFTFAARVTFATLAFPSAVAIGDVNGDGKPDLAVVHLGLSSVSVLLNLTVPGGAPSFGAAHGFSTASVPDGVTIGDLNGDGKPDLAAACEGADAVSVLLNTTSPGADPPTFAAHQDIPSGLGPSGAPAIGDINLDGKMDLATSNLSDGTFTVLLNTTAPGATTLSFQPKADLTTGATPLSAGIVDMNGDGLPDLITANSSSDNVSLFMYTTMSSADIAVHSGSGQSAQVTAPFAPLQAVVKTGSGVPVQLVPVTFAAIAGASSASGMFGEPTTVLTDGSGIATAPVLTANLNLGTFTATATTSYTFSSATFNLANEALHPPTNLVATAVTPTSVSITWTANPYATTYNVVRVSQWQSGGALLASHLNSLSFTDTTASPNTAYLYYVGAADPALGLAGKDLAATVIFTDPTLTPGSTPVKAVHFTELRTAVNAVQVLAGQNPTSFTDSPLVPGVTTIQAIHQGQLRQALDPARSQMLLPAIGYTHPPPVHGTTITAADLNDLRNGVK